MLIEIEIPDAMVGPRLVSQFTGSDSTSGVRTIEIPEGSKIEIRYCNMKAGDRLTFEAFQNAYSVVWNTLVADGPPDDSRDLDQMMEHSSAAMSLCQPIVFNAVALSAHMDRYVRYCRNHGGTHFAYSWAMQNATDAIGEMMDGIAMVARHLGLSLEEVVQWKIDELEWKGSDSYE